MAFSLGYLIRRDEIIPFIKLSFHFIYIYIYIYIELILKKNAFDHFFLIKVTFSFRIHM